MQFRGLGTYTGAIYNDSQLGIVKMHQDSMTTSYDLSPGIKVFGYEARKVVNYSTSVDFFLVYLVADASDSDRRLAKKLHMRAYAHYNPEVVVIDADNTLPNPRYRKILSRGHRDRNGDFDGEDKSTEIGPAIFDGQRILVIECAVYSGDPG